jgi:hypothetical protein
LIRIARRANLAFAFLGEPGMIEYNEDHYRDLCRTGRVAMEIAAIEDNRRQAVRRFWILLAIVVALAVAVVWAMSSDELLGFGIVIAVFILIVGGIVAALPLGKAGKALKIPVLETLAEKGGLTFMENGFDPPVYPDARPALFGNWLNGQAFTDLFHGQDADGRRFALYEGTLTRRSGKNTHTVFAGQMYAWQRRAKEGGEIVIVPDRGLFNFFKPVSGMERVRFEGDAEFEKKFEVYAYEPQRAQMTIGADVRRVLLDLRQKGKVFGYVGPEDIFVAATGKNRFEAGSMFRRVGGEQRVRAMFDDVCAGLSVLKRLRAALD